MTPKVPYAAYPKYGPEVLGQSEYDRQIRAWEAYQASLRQQRPEGESPETPQGHEGQGGDEAGSKNPTKGEVDPSGVEAYTYVQKYRLAGQERKRVFREQGILASNKSDARKQGREAMERTLGPQVPELWSPVPGSERVVKPRGKPFEQGSDERRNAEGENGHGGGGGGEGQGQGGQGQGDGERGESQGEQGEGGQDDTPQMPTCPECGAPKGSTEGCCKPEKPGEIPKPQDDSEGKADLQLLRNDGQAPYTGEAAEERLRLAAHPEVVEVLTKSLADVDTWTRALVAHDVNAMATDLYGALTKSHKALVAKINKLPKGTPESGQRELTKGQVRSIVEDMLKHAKVDVDALAARVAEKIQSPRRIVIESNGKRVEIKGTPHAMFEPALKAVTRGLNVFLVGPAGSGKGFLAQHISEALDRRFGFISCSEGMSEGMLLGRGVPLAERFMYLQSSFVDFYENGGVFLLDEIDAANPNVLLIINECLSSPHLSIPNRTEKPYATRHADFVAIVAANTWGTGPNMEYVGRNRLDAAFLNRFIGSQFELGYDAKIEGAIANAYLGSQTAEAVLRRFWGVRKKLEELNIRRIWSTRGLEKMCVALADGDDMATVLDAHTRGWTRDERTKAGVA